MTQTDCLKVIQIDIIMSAGSVYPSNRTIERNTNLISF